MKRSDRDERPHAAQQEKGFTLLEVLAAVLILGLAYVATLESFSVALRNIDKAERTRAMVFADMVEFCQAVRFVGLESLPTDEEKEEEEAILFMEGSRLRLLEVRSASGELAALRLDSVL